MGSVLEVQLDTPINLARSSPFPTDTCAPLGRHVPLACLPWLAVIASCSLRQCVDGRSSLCVTVGTALYWHILCVLASILTPFFEAQGQPKPNIPTKYPAGIRREASPTKSGVLTSQLQAPVHSGHTT